MSNWPASKATRVLAALERIGWRVKRQHGSHRLLTRPDWPDYEFAFHDRDEIGSRMLARIAKRTGQRPEDLMSAWESCLSLLPTNAAAAWSQSSPVNAFETLSE